MTYSYLAGIIDGEGNFSVVKHVNDTSRGWNYQPCLGVSNTDKNLVEWCEWFTGCGGCWSKDYKKRKKKHKLPWVWQVYDMSDIIKIVDAVVPFLIVKEQQALLLMEFCTIRLAKLKYWNRKRDRKGRFIRDALAYSSREHEIYNLLKELNHR